MLVIARLAHIDTFQVSGPTSRARGKNQVASPFRLHAPCTSFPPRRTSMYQSYDAIAWHNTKGVKRSQFSTEASVPKGGTLYNFLLGPEFQAFGAKNKSLANRPPQPQLSRRTQALFLLSLVLLLKCSGSGLEVEEMMSMW